MGSDDVGVISGGIVGGESVCTALNGIAAASSDIDVWDGACIVIL